MKRLVALSALVGGALLILVPRYILPACEYEGHPRMHCSDTARAEYLIGALLIGIGGVTFFLKSPKALLVAAAGAMVLFTGSFFMPNVYGYCRSSHMPCNYGMVPGIRFIAVLGSIIVVGAGVSLLKSLRKKGNS